MALVVRGAGDVMAWWIDRWMDSGRRRRWCWWCTVRGGDGMDGWLGGAPLRRPGRGGGRRWRRKGEGER